MVNKSRTFTRKTLATAQPKLMRQISNLSRSITRQLKTSKRNTNRIRSLETKIKTRKI